MNSYMWLSLLAFTVCLVSCIYHFVRLVRLGKPQDYSKPMGAVDPAVRYAFFRAMDPRKKESAYLHLPTYTAGILYHLGTFLSLSLFILFLFKVEPHGMARLLIIGFLIITGLSGLAILLKRLIKKELKALSNPDDYVSNILVTAVQLMTAISLYNPRFLPWYFILVSIFFLYLPLGKLKHTVFFFAARYHLGYFYGWRGVWPPK